LRTVTSPNNLPTTNDPNFVKKNISNWNFNDQSTRLAANSPGYYSGKDRYSVEKTGYVSGPSFINYFSKKIV